MHRPAPRPYEIRDGWNAARESFPLVVSDAMPPSKRIRIPWSDRFHQPTLAELVAPLPPVVAPLVDFLRTGARLRAAREQLNVVEEIRWLGVPWHWSLMLRTARDPSRGWVYVIPQPERPAVVIPLVQAAVPDLRHASKAVRDGVVFARLVGSVRWAQWDLTSRTLADEILNLAELQLAQSEACPRPAVMTRGPVLANA